ncbi:MAG: phytoene synthase [Rickettsiales bacterium]|nr:phytoene synthase [Rickettsiales bacterium]|tara:strand:+ start:203 stop:1039 length:837 start_codon:yes stop_codon:yes gene_type:complete
MQPEAQSSFALGMRMLSRERRRSLHAVYRFCHTVDALADETEREIALDELEAWRQRLERFYAGDTNALPSELATAITQYDLEKRYFLGMLEGMRMDVAGEMLRPTQVLLERYCYNVAGCAGLLSLPIFGCQHPASVEIAKALGQGLQHINIWRDIEEDATRGRIYLPKEWLEKAGYGNIAPEEVLREAAVLRHACLPYMQASIATQLRKAKDHISRQDAWALFPAYLMWFRYEIMWERMLRHQSSRKRKRDIPLILLRAMRLALKKQINGVPRYGPAQ